MTTNVNEIRHRAYLATHHSSPQKREEIARQIVEHDVYDLLDEVEKLRARTQVIEGGEIDALRQAVSQMTQELADAAQIANSICLWSEAGGDAASLEFKTSCGHLFWTEGDIEAAGLVYCPYCGFSILEEAACD